MKKIVIVLTGLFLMAGVCFGGEEPPPSADFIKGFEAGVRYGLISYLQDPVDDIPTIIKHAKAWYWLIVVDNGKTLIDGCTPPNPLTDPK